MSKKSSLHDYRIARKSKNISPKNRNMNSVVGGIASKLRFFIGFIIIGSLLCFGLVKFILPAIITVQEPRQIIVVEEHQEGNRFYFVHINPTASLNYSAVLPKDEPIKIPFVENEVTLDSVLKENNQVLSTMYSHMVGTLLNEIMVIPVHEMKHPKKTADIFTTAFNKNDPLSFSQRWKLLYYYILSQKNSAAIQSPSALASVAEGLSDNQSMWQYNQTRECPIAVINTTETQGLANSYSKVLEKSGAFIIRVNSESALKDKSTIYSSENKACNDLIQGIQHLFPHTVEVITDETKTQEYRAGIVLFLGKDAYTL